MYILLILVCPSCNEDMDLEDSIYQSQNYDSDEYMSVDFSIETYSEPETRCFETKYIYSLEVNQKGINGMPDDGCSSYSNLENLYAQIYYEDIKVYDLTLLIRNAIPSFSGSQIINKIQRNGNSVLLSLKLDKNWDPSKVEIIVTGGFLTRASPVNGVYVDMFNNYIINKGENGESFIKNEHPDICCNYYCRHKISADNSWESIDKKIVLKRLNCDFIFLTTQVEASVPSQIESYLYAVPNFEDDVRGLLGKYTGSYSLSDCRYHFLSDKATYELDKSLIYRTDRNQKVITSSNNGVSFGRPAIGLPSFTYKNQRVYLFSLCSVLGTQETKYLEDTKGEQLKYITLVRYDGSKYYLMADQTHYYEWSTIPMPEGGIKANTRYIYILGNGFKFWQNRISKEELEDMAVIRSSELSGDIQVEDVTIIEQSMDDPLPFEFIEE